VTLGFEQAASAVTSSVVVVSQSLFQAGLPFPEEAEAEVFVFSNVLSFFAPLRLFDDAVFVNDARLLDGTGLADEEARRALLAAIHGYKFEDANGNGRDDGEPRLPGVMVTLRGDSDGDGEEDEKTLRTDARGRYGFPDLVPGAYTVTETPPEGSKPTKPPSTRVEVDAGEAAVAEAGQAGPLWRQLGGIETIDRSLAFGNQSAPVNKEKPAKSQDAPGAKSQEDGKPNGANESTSNFDQRMRRAVNAAFASLALEQEFGGYGFSDFGDRKSDTVGHEVWARRVYTEAADAAFCQMGNGKVSD